MAKLSSTHIFGNLVVDGNIISDGNIDGNADTASKVNNSIKIQLNGGTTENANQFTFDGSEAKNVNITPSSIGAATTSTVTTSANGLMSSIDKSKLDGIAANANNYSHPTTSGNKHIPSGGSSGQILRWSADGTAVWGNDNNTTYSANTGIKLNGTTFQHTNSVTAGTAQGDANKTLTFGGTFTIPTVTYDAQGHITGKGTTTMTMPATPTSVSGNAGSASKVNNSIKIQLNGGTIEGTNQFTFNGSAAKNINITPSSIGAATTSIATTSANGLMSSTDKSKLDGIATNANNYSHPTYTSKTSGLYKVTVDGTGHVSATTAVTKADITGLGIPGSNTTYSVATTSANGLMSSTDKSKLDGIATNANNYSHPTTSGNKHIPSGGSSGQILRWSADGTAVWGNDNNTTYSTGTASALGLTKLYTGTGTATDGTMTQAALKTALDGKAASSHTHGLLHDNFTVELANTTTDSGWSMINSNYTGHLLKSLRTNASAPAWILNNYSAGIVFGGADTKGVMSMAYNSPSVRFAGGNGTKPVWYFTLTGTSAKSYNMDSLAANTANTLATTRTINGTNFNGSANITTANWGTARTINGISVNGSTNYILPVENYCCDVGNDNTNLYHKILESGQVTGSWTDKSIVLFVTNAYQGGGHGIVKITLRTNDISSAANASGEIRWLVRSGLAVDSIVFNIVNQSKNVYMDVFYKCPGTYCGLTWYVLSEGQRSSNHSKVWTKFNTSATSGAYTEANMKTLRSYTATLQTGSDSGQVASANTLATARTINGTSFNGSANITTANWGTARNIYIADNSSTNTGPAVSVNGSGNATLKLPATIKATLSGNASTATKATQDSAGQQINTTYIKGLSVSGKTITYTKGDGTTGTITTQDTNTTYSTGTTSASGLTKLYTGTGTATDGTMTQAAIKTALDGKAASSHGNHVPTTQTANNAVFLRNDNTWQTVTPANIGAAASSHTHNYAGSSSAGGAANSAVKATQDSAGQQINTTYIKGLSVSGKTITYTKGDGTTGTITTQDTNTTYSTGTASALGLTKLYTGTGTATDGTMTQAAIKSALDGKAASSHGTHVSYGGNGSATTVSRSDHTHNQINSRGSVTAESGVTGRPAVSGLSMSEVYNNGYPTPYGNVISLKGTGDGQILVGWSDTDGAHAPVYVRSKRDNTSTANWSGWAQVYTTANKPSASDIGAATSSHTHTTINSNFTVTDQLFKYKGITPSAASSAVTGGSGYGYVQGCNISIGANSDIPSGTYGACLIGYSNTTQTDDTFIMGSENESHNFGNLILGRNNVIDARDSYVVGEYNTVNSSSSYIVGSGNTVGGNSTAIKIVLGSDNTLNGNGVAIGMTNNVDAYYGAAIGCNTKVFDDGGYAIGYYARAHAYQLGIGHYGNVSSGAKGWGTEGTAFVIGNGGGENSCSNACRITYAGAVIGKAAYASSGADYAEYFEWLDGNPNNEDRVGYFVTMEGDKIKIAKEGDYLLGVVSGYPAVIGNNDMEWQGQFLTDDFGRPIKEKQTKSVHKDPEDENSEIEIKEYEYYVLNPNYNPNEKYIHREDRPEWDTVGMLGVLSVYDDGTCKVNGYCKCNNEGIATACERGFDTYRVIKRVNDRIVKIIFNIK